MNIHKLQSCSGTNLVILLQKPDHSGSFSKSLTPFETFEVTESQITDDVKQKIKTRLLRIIDIRVEDALILSTPIIETSSIPLHHVKSKKKFRKKQK